MAEQSLTMANVTSADYKDMLPQVLLTMACSEGGYSMKRGFRSDKSFNSAFAGNSYEGSEALLPMPNPADQSPANKARYASYKARAVVVEMTKRTKSTLSGAATRKDNVVELPKSIAYLEDNADNAGTTLETQYKQSIEIAMDEGTLGLLVDIPSDGNISQADINNGVRAGIKIYDFMNILNASYSIVGNQEKLSYVLLRECVAVRDGLQVDYEYQYRKLELDEEGYYVHTLLDDSLQVISDPVMPTDASGNRLMEIPFYPIGAQNNTLKKLDPPLLLGIAELNVGQYRNSADVEENAYMSSQSTNFLMIDDVETFNTNNPDGLALGANSLNFIGQDDKYEMHQAQETNLSNTLQLQKIDQAVSLGAQLIMNSGRAETAEAVRTKAAESSASVSSVVDNSEMAYNKALAMCESIMSTQSGEIAFQANKDFIDSTLTPEEVTKWIEMSVTGMVNREAFTTAMVKGGWLPEGTKATDIQNAVEVEGE